MNNIHGGKTGERDHGYDKPNEVGTAYSYIPCSSIWYGHRLEKRRWNKRLIYRRCLCLGSYGVIFSHNGGHFSSVALSISQAIVFISLGVSSIREDNKPCPDPTFYLWATMGAGLILGLGLYMVAFFSTAYILLIETLGQRNGNEYRFIEAGRLEINLTKNNLSFEEARERLGEFDIHIKNISLVHNNMGESIFKASILTHSSISISETVDKMISSPFIDSISLLSVE